MLTGSWMIDSMMSSGRTSVPAKLRPPIPRPTSKSPSDSRSRTAPDFLTTFADPLPLPPPSPMVDESWAAKGKRKRLPEEEGVDDIDGASNQGFRPRPRLRLFTATAITFGNVAATEWASHFPGETSVRPNERFNIYKVILHLQSLLF